MENRDTEDKCRQIIHERDVVFTDDIREAVSDDYLHSCLHFIILTGKMTFSIGLREQHAHQGDCIIIPNRPRILSVEVSDDFTMTGVIVSGQFMQAALPKTSYKTRGVITIAQNPVIRLSPEEMQLVSTDFRRIRMEHRRVAHIYYFEIVARAYELLVLDINDIYLRHNSYNLKSIDQTAWITQQFIDLLQQGLVRKHRTVSYYASRLNISPQYLSECCFKFSGHNASFFIEHFTAEEIARMLTCEDLQITDVAYRLNFNTTNYFTRYVKRILGMTPSEYKARYNIKK